jgi:protein-disulfide isomerase
MDEKKSALDSFSPKQTFLFGAVGGILVLCTIGFFILLSTVLGGDSAPARVVTAPSQPSAVDQGTGGPPAQVSVAPVDDKVDHIRGNKKAKITLIEYSDFECPFCSRFTPTVDEMLATYGDDVNFVYRHFPLTSIHPQAEPAANAAECAGDQGKFYEFHDDLFANQTRLGSALYTELAEKHGLNVSTFNDCVSSQKFADKVTSDSNDAVAAGGRGTPYSVLIGPDGQTTVISGAQPFSAVQGAIEAML